MGAIVASRSEKVAIDGGYAVAIGRADLARFPKRNAKTVVAARADKNH